MKYRPQFPFKSPFILAAFCFAFLLGCGGDPLRNASLSAAESAFERHEITAGGFHLTVFSRIEDANQPVTVYIEGDVRGWVPTADPGIDASPDEYLGLRLATLDPAENVVVIAHPCQFGIDDEACRSQTWKNGRLAAQIYTAINRALDYTVSVVPRARLNLVGYSGGGAIAALLAARRHDVISLRTIAGNLDPNGNGRTHGSVPQNDFIDPMEIAPRLALLPQEHFVGGKDLLIPPFLTENFVKAIGLSYCVKVTPIEEASHKTGWEEAWNEHAERMPVCGALQRKQ